MKNLYTLVCSLVLMVAIPQSLLSQSISLSQPVASTTYIDNVSVSYLITDPAGTPQSIRLTFTYTSGPDTTAGAQIVLVLASTSPSGSFSFNPSTVTSNVIFQSVTPNVPMPDGAWSVFASYVRAVSGGGATVSSATKTNVRTDTKTYTPFLYSPISNQRVSTSFLLKDTLFENALTNSKKITFTGPVTTVLLMNNTLRKDSFNLNVNNLSASSASILSALPSNTLSEGVYTVSLEYRDASSHPVATTTITNLTIDTHTETPTLTSTDATSNVGNTINLSYTLPEAILPGSAKLIITDGASVTKFLTLSNSITTGTHTIAVNAANLSATPSVVGVSPTGNLPNGNYTVTLSYQDDLGNPIATSSSVGPLSVDVVTLAPTLISPATGTTSSSTVNIQYTLPETPLSGSVKLLFNNGTRTDTLVLSSTMVGSFNLNTSSISPNADVISTTTSSLAAGTYSVTLLYQDQYSNPIASTTSTGYTIDRVTQAPVLNLPGSFSSATGNIPVDFTLPENAQPGSVLLQFFGPASLSITLNDETAGNHSFALDGTNIGASSHVAGSTPNFLPSGNYAVALSYKDIFGNPQAFILATNFNFTAIILPIGLSQLRGYLQNEATHLIWKTSSESNSAFFEIEYSTDAQHFTKVGQVAAAGDAVDERSYQFVHDNPSASRNYYRLRMVDKDGSFKYSGVIIIYNETKTDKISIYPNPVQDQLNVLMTSSDNAKQAKTLTIWDLNGKIISKRNITILKGSNLFTIPTKGLLPGTYLIQDGQRISRFIKL